MSVVFRRFDAVAMACAVIVLATEAVRAVAGVASARVDHARAFARCSRRAPPSSRASRSRLASRRSTRPARSAASTVRVSSSARLHDQAEWCGKTELVLLSVVLVLHVVALSTPPRDRRGARASRRSRLPETAACAAGRLHRTRLHVKMGPEQSRRLSAVPDNWRQAHGDPQIVRGTRRGRSRRASIAAGCSSSDGTTGDGERRGRRGSHSQDARRRHRHRQRRRQRQRRLSTERPASRARSDSDCVSATRARDQHLQHRLRVHDHERGGLAVGDAGVHPAPAPDAGRGQLRPGAAGSTTGFPHFCDGPDDADVARPLRALRRQQPAAGRRASATRCARSRSTARRPTGCVGTDTCFPVTFLRSISDGTVTGYGFCGGGCQQDSDCTPLGAGFVCQTDIGYCTQKKRRRAPSRSARPAP